jgi:hypothetical protein
MSIITVLIPNWIESTNSLFKSWNYDCISFEWTKS